MLHNCFILFFYFTFPFTILIMSDRFERKGYTPRSLEIVLNSLPLPPTYDEVVAENPEHSPLNEEDFQRLYDFFIDQIQYYQSFADNEQNPEVQKVFVTWVQRIPELFHVIRENTRIITEPLFQEALEQMRKKIYAFIGDSPYLVLLHGNDKDAMNHSTYFISRQLDIPEEKLISEHDLKDPEIQKYIQDGVKVVIIDDASYSAGNILSHLRNIEKVSFIREDQMMVSLVGITSVSVQNLQREFPMVLLTSEYRIPILSEILENDDYRILRFMHRPNDEGDSEQIPAQYHEVLTLFWQKVPDNFCRPLRKFTNKWWDGEQHHFYPGYLVDDTPNGIFPSYRKGKTFIYS